MGVGLGSAGLKQLLHILNVMGAARERFPQTPPSSEIRFAQSRSLNLGDDLLPPIVSTPSGEFEGYHMKVMNGRSVYAFEGIPYAERVKRFEVSVLKRPFAGRLMAKSPGVECTQIFAPHMVKPHWTNTPPVIGSDDCLTCDIYTPNIAHNGSHPKLPVIVHIHGGGFGTGTGSDWGPAYLLVRDMVLVQCQYRLGLLGFLSTGDDVLPGNLGLKDVRTSLDWIHANILHFGGDPQKITLHGISAGGALAHFLIMSPYAHEGKIASAIIGSGNAFCPWALESLEGAKKLSHQVGVLSLCPTTRGSQELVNCLRKRGPRMLLIIETMTKSLGGRFAQYFSPVVELPSKHAMITDTPKNLYARKMVAKIPVIFTVCERDADSIAINWHALTPLPFPTQLLMGFLPEFFQYNHHDVRRRVQMTEELLNFYGGREKVSRKKELLFDAFQDFYFAVPTWRSLRHHHRLAPTYAIMYTYRSQRVSTAKKFKIPDEEILVPHAEDELMIYNRTEFKYLTSKDRDFPVIQRWREIFYNFATARVLRYGDEDGVKALMEVESIRTPDHFQLLLLGKEMIITGASLVTNVTRFWDAFDSMK